MNARNLDTRINSLVELERVYLATIIAVSLTMIFPDSSLIEILREKGYTTNDLLSLNRGLLTWYAEILNVEE